MKVPTYDTPQAEARPLPGARQSSVASPALFGGGAEQQVATGRALTVAGSGLSAVAGRMEERENADTVFRVDGALKRDFIDYEQDVRKNRQGRFAAGLVEDTDKWFAEQEKKHGAALTNDVQRQLFGQRLQSLRMSALGSFSRYQDAQLEKSHDEGWLADKNATVSIASADPSQVDAAVREINRLNRYQAARKGWEAPVVEQENTKDTTALHTNVLKTLADKNPEAAREYLTKYKDQIDGRKMDDIERVLKHGETKQAAFQFANKNLDAGLTLEQQLEAARDFFKDEPEKREAAIHEIKSRAAEGEAIRQRSQRDASDTAWKVIAAGGGTQQIPAATWTAMSGQDQRHALDYLDARTRKTDGAGKDDLANLDKVERMIEQGDITERAQLARYDAFFSKSTLKTLATKIDKRGVVSPIDLRREFEERKGAKVNVAKMSEGERAEWMAFQDYILANVKETKRPEDVGAWADRWFMKGYGKDDSVFTNDPDTYGEARTKGRKDFVVTTPEALRANVDSALSILARNGVPMPKDKTLARDEFYTNHALEAERWAGAHGVQNSPELTAAYALLKQAKKPVTAGNLDYVIKQFKK